MSSTSPSGSLLDALLAALISAAAWIASQLPWLHELASWLALGFSILASVLSILKLLSRRQS